MKRYILLILFFVLTTSACHALLLDGPVKTLDIPAYKVRGADYLPLILVCDAYGINWEWDSASRVVELSKGTAKLKLAVGDYKVYLNGAISLQERPVIIYRGAVCIPSEFIRTIFGKFFIAGPGIAIEAPSEPRYKIGKIIIDAGHGGYDPGAISRRGIKEKYIVLDIAKKVKELLEVQGIEVVMTRPGDEFVPLWDRVNIANREKADLFVSIHANASRTKRLSGVEVYYISEAIDDDARAAAVAENSAPGFGKKSVYANSKELNTILWDIKLAENRRNAIKLGNCILDAIGAKKRPIKYARFCVLRGTAMPSVLVEVGYLTNLEECIKLNTQEYRDEMAGEITNGILEYKKEYESSDGFTGEDR